MSVPARFAGRGLAAVAAAAYATLVMAHADALRAAGVTGTAPPNAGAIRKFVDSLADNVLWLFGTTALLAISVIGGLFFIGHSRAGDVAAKVAAGALILVSAPGIAA